ncbi:MULTISPECIES: enoyl-CoA hydratase/isomerase family protein [Hyphomicrobiales]|jgi:enoyl-CoA hydratase|nr:enoyl-CoA hydratase-related protein [Xanthobacter flavus]MBA4789480.1 enoyl-CoA hydratase/isomerase family protein [Hyphomicrobiales bacterium]GLI20877.1 enoyl-CoA hydratase [Xanthobacter flavus]
MHPDEIVQFEAADGLATITLNRPERRNALSVAAAERLFDLWEEVDRRPEIRAVILTAAPCGTFCAGMDLKEASSIGAKGGDVLQIIRDPFHERMRRVRAPIIAAMTGHFAAGGFMLSLNADIRIGVAGTSGGITEVKRGRGSPWAVPLLWQMPQPLVMEMVLTGEPQTIERLHAIGFVNYVEPTAEAALERARTLARIIVANAPLSVAAGKQSLLNAMSLGCDAGLAEAKQIYRSVYDSRDAQEGPRAFAEKRAPVWTGT